MSPLLSNILLNDFDKELEKRGHTFWRYADDCNVYVKSEQAWGWSIRRTIETLNPKLRGWITYFRHIRMKGILEELDGWLRRHLRKMVGELGGMLAQVT